MFMAGVFLVSIPSSSNTAQFIRSTLANLRSHSPSGVAIHDSNERGPGGEPDGEPGGEPAVYHVSVSRTVPVRQLEIDAMVEALSKLLTQHERCVYGACASVLSFDFSWLRLESDGDLHIAFFYPNPISG